MKLMGTKLFVKRIKEENVSESGLVLSTLEKEPYVKAEICKIGGEVKPIFVPGQVIMYERSVGNKITVEGEEFVMINEWDVIVIL